jgi:hypothetical protein
LEGKTPVEAVKAQAQKQNLSNQQAYELNRLVLTGPKPEIVTKNSLPDFVKDQVKGLPSSIYVYQNGFSSYTNNDLEVWSEIDVNGNVNFLGDRGDVTIYIDTLKPNRYSRGD